MHLSGRVRQTDVPDQVSVEMQGSTLQPDQLTTLNSLYQGLIPDYSKLVQEYAEDKRSFNFPSMNSWSPRGRPLSERERLFLLQGPGGTITLLKRLLVRNTLTGQVITYSPATNDKENSKVSSSYVAYTEPNSPPQFGRIESLFKHNFCSTEYTWANVQFFENPVQDSETGLWCVDDRHYSHHFVLLSNISIQLMVAVEKLAHQIWFLNF